MSHLHRLFICLGIILELKYTTYALISAFILRFACFMFMCKIGLNKPKCMNRRTILRLCSSKRMAKVAQRHPMQTNCGNYHDPKHLRTMQQSEAQEQRSQRPPRLAHRGAPQTAVDATTMAALLFPNCVVFWVAVKIMRILGVRNLEFVHNAMVFATPHPSTIIIHHHHNFFRVRLD